MTIDDVLKLHGIEGQLKVNDTFEGAFEVDTGQGISKGDLIEFSNGKLVKSETKVNKLGIEETINAGDTDFFNVVRLTDEKAIVCYRDKLNSYYGTARVLDINSSKITARAEKVFKTGNAIDISTAKLTDTKVIVCYCNNGTDAEVRILTIAGDTVTVITGAWIFSSGDADYISAAGLTDDIALLCYSVNGVGKVRILDIQPDDTIVLGNEQEFESVTANYTSLARLTDTKAIVCYQDSDNLNYGTSRVLDISGSTVTVGAKEVFESDNTYGMSVARLTDTKAIVCYMNTNGLGEAKVLDINESTITVADGIMFSNIATQDVSVARLTDTRAIVCFREAGGVSKGSAYVLSIYGSGIKVGTKIEYNDALAYYTSVARLTDTEAIVCYRDDVGDGKAITLEDIDISVDGISKGNGTEGQTINVIYW